MAEWLTPYEFEFFRNGVILATMAGALCGLLGVFMVQRGMSYMGHGLSHALFDELGQLPEVVVAGSDLRPRVGDADEGLGEGLVAVADGLVHGPRGSAPGAVDDGSAVLSQL